MSQCNYFKNFILCGDIGFFCLLCMESFKLPEEVIRHVRWEVHRKLVKSQAYFPKFHKDFIYKVDNQFYCEICNHVSQSMDLAAKHVRSETHKTNKVIGHKAQNNGAKSNEKNNNNTQKAEVKEELNGEVVVIANTFVLKIEEWHGVVNKQCYLCDIIVESWKDFDKHVSTDSHIIKLMVAKVVVEDGKYYRKKNEETLYCLQCKTCLPVESIKEHWETTDLHTTKPYPPRAMLDSFDIHEKIAICRDCKIVQSLRFDPLLIHWETHTKGAIKGDPNEMCVYYPGDRGKLRAELKTYGKDYFIKLTQAGKKGYCQLCHVYIVPHMNSFKEHVNGSRHHGFMELKGLVKKTGKKVEKPRFKTKPWSEFLRSFVRLNDSNIALVNSEVCIPLVSFATICLKIPDMWKCFICDVAVVNVDLLKGHLQEHKEKCDSVPTICNLKGEVIREVQPSMYHCGHCNVVYPGVALLEKHLASAKHAQARELTCKEFTNTVLRPRRQQIMNSIDILD